MALQLVLKLQTPTIELKVKPKDASGVTDPIIVGFKRYDVKETQTKFKKLQELYKDIDEENPSTDKLDEFLANEIVYLKDITVPVEDTITGETKLIKVADTRTAKPVEALWVDGDECKAVLTSAYLSSAPYRASLIAAQSKALLNNDYEEAAAKN